MHVQVEPNPVSMLLPYFWVTESIKIKKVHASPTAHYRGFPDCWMCELASAAKRYKNSTCKGCFSSANVSFMAQTWRKLRRQKNRLLFVEQHACLLPNRTFQAVPIFHAEKQHCHLYSYTSCVNITAKERKVLCNIISYYGPCNAPCRNALSFSRWRRSVPNALRIAPWPMAYFPDNRLFCSSTKKNTMCLIAMQVHWLNAARKDIRAAPKSQPVSYKLALGLGNSILSPPPPPSLWIFAF